MYVTIKGSGVVLMKVFVLFFFILICKLFAFRAEGGEEEISLPSAIPEKEAAKREDSVMRTTRLESGVVVVENLKHPNEILDLVMRNHFMSCHIEPGSSLTVSVGKNDGQKMFSLSVYDKTDRFLCRYWFTSGDFSVLDYDGDGLADVRQNSSRPKYEIRLNDEWVPCREIRLKDHRAVVSDGSIYKFERGKWRMENSVSPE